jgi:2'-5' RNA ligase
MLIESVPDAAQMRDHWWLRPGWQPGTRMLAWHLTFEGESALHTRAQEAQRALAGFDTLDPVPPEWLHLSLADFGAADEVTEDCVRQAINAAHEHIAAIGPLELRFSRTVVFAESVVMMPDESSGLAQLRTSLQESVRQVRGAGAPPTGDNFSPHVSVAYANGTTDGSDVLRALETAGLDDVTPVHPTLTLVELHRAGHLYRWRPVSAFPL